MTDCPVLPVSPVDRIAAKFGGQTALGNAIGVDQSTIAQWKRRGGIVPSRQQRKILDKARELGIAVEPADFFDRAA